VLTAAVNRADVPVYLDAVGTTRPLNTVTVRPQVDGKLISVNFIEGQDVKKGDVLARIDPTTFKAQLDQALAKKAQDEALLTNAKNDLARYQKLAAMNAINRQQADTQRALVAQYTAQVQADQGAIENAQATRNSDDLRVGVSTRGALCLYRASQALALTKLDWLKATQSFLISFFQPQTGYRSPKSGAKPDEPAAGLGVEYRI